MKISKSSWHYGLYRFIRNVPESPRHLIPWADVPRQDYPVSKSLCPYAWTIFLGLVGVFFTALALIVLGAVAAPFFVLYKAARWLDRSVRMPEIHLSKRERKPKPRKEKHPSLVLAFVKARKEKACPMIELVD